MEQNKISRLLRKIRRFQVISLLGHCLILAGCSYLIWKLAGQIERQYLWSSPLIVFISTGTVLLFLLSRSLAWIVSHNRRTIAAAVDRLYDLKDRLSTYTELEKNGHPFLNALTRETSSKLANISVFRALELKSILLPSVALFLFLISAMLVLPYLPIPDSILAKQLEQKRIDAKGKELAEFVRELEKKPIPAELKKLTQEFKKLAQELQKPSVDKAEALKRLNALEEKQKYFFSANQQKLADDLKKAWQEAAQADPDRGGLTADQKAAMEQLAKDFQGALEGQEPSEGMQTEKLNTEKLDGKDLKSLKEALKKYQEQKSHAEQMRAELQKALDSTRKTTSSGKGTFTADSHLKDRDLEKGKGGVEDGPGTTNQDSGPSHFDTSKKGTGEYVDDRTKSKYERMYEGQRENVGKDPVYLQSQWDENGNPQYTRVRNFGLNKDATGKNAPNQIVSQNQDESAVRKERVPPSHQKIVKEYFEAIEE